MEQSKKRAAGIAALCISLLGFSLFMPLYGAVVLEPHDPHPGMGTHKKVLVVPGPDTDDDEGGFVISYTHSVNKGRVKDFYRIVQEEGRVALMVYKTQFLSYGAGIPEPEGNEIFTVTDEYIEISGIDRTMPYLVMAVGVIADHCIEIGTTVFTLKKLFSVQQRLKIIYKKVSVIQYIDCLLSHRIIKSNTKQIRSSDE